MTHSENNANCLNVMHYSFPLITLGKSTFFFLRRLNFFNDLEKIDFFSKPLISSKSFMTFSLLILNDVLLQSKVKSTISFSSKKSAEKRR